MTRLTVNLNGRNYNLTCGAGEEPRLQQLAAFVSEQLATLSDEFGHVGDDRLMVMSLLLLADDLLEARDRVSALEKLLPTKELAKLARLAADRFGTGADEPKEDALEKLEAELPQASKPLQRAEPPQGTELTKNDDRSKAKRSVKG